MCISRQCCCLFLIPVLLIYCDLFQSAPVFLRALTLESTAKCGQHMFTCAWTTKKSRMSGAGPAVIQVRVPWQFGNMAAHRCCAFTPKANTGFLFSCCFSPLPLAKAPNASLSPLWQLIHKNCRDLVALLLKFRELRSHFGFAQNIPGFFSVVLKRIQTGLKVKDIWKIFIEARSRSSPETSRDPPRRLH